MNSFTSKMVRMGFRYYSTPPTPIVNPAMPPTKLFINNEWVDATSGKTFKVYNPVNDEVITEVQKAGKEDVDRAVQAAKEAFKLNAPWRLMDASKRGQLLVKLADLMDKDAGYLSSLEALECGKVYSATYKGDIPWGSNSLRYMAGLTDKNYGEVSNLDGKYIAYTRHEPVGVCGLITAWNFSTVMVVWKLAAALAAGCTAIIKPSQHSTLAALRVAELIKIAGFPPGVVNFVTGSGEIGNMLVEHPDIDKISFTGSTPIGQEIYAKCAQHVKRVTLELGGKSPNIILKDANIDRAVDHGHLAAFHNMGQCCCAGSRTFVHESIYDEYVEKSIKKAKARKIGNPFDFSTEHGPQATKQQLEVILDMIETGKREGGEVVAGGQRVGDKGNFVQPTVFIKVDDQATISQEEIFGPVQQITKFSTIDEVIQRANNSKFGLASSVFSNDMDSVNKIVQSLRAGSVWVNSYFVITPHNPFGGYKMSGIGREGARYGINAFQEVKSVTIKTTYKTS